MNYQEFLEKIFKNLNQAGINVTGLEIDHVAYRATSNETYAAKLADLQKVGKLLDITMIQNRPIAIIKLTEPIKYQGFKIPYFELMAPKEGDKYDEGLEHAEIVVENLGKFKEKYPNLEFEFKERKINPELVLKFPNDANIKFHLKNIEEVIKLQKQTGEL